MPHVCRTLQLPDRNPRIYPASSKRYILITLITLELEITTDVFYTSENTSAVICQDNSTIVIFFIYLNYTADNKIVVLFTFCFWQWVFNFFGKHLFEHIPF
jgi:hypothetical protein